MTNEDERELHAELARLQQEHRDLDAAIDALHQSPAPDLLRLQRFNKRKIRSRRTLSLKRFAAGASARVDVLFPQEILRADSRKLLD